MYSIGSAKPKQWPAAPQEDWASASLSRGISSNCTAASLRLPATREFRTSGHHQLAVTTRALISSQQLTDFAFLCHLKSHYRTMHIKCKSVIVPPNYGTPIALVI